MKESFLSKYDINLWKEKNISQAKEIKLEGNLIINEQNPLGQIYFFQKCDFLLLGGYPDNSFHFFKESGEFKFPIPKLHNNLISCLTVSEKLNLIITGSKDCRVIIWNFDPKMNFAIEQLQILYGHNNEVVSIEINDILNIIVSIDKDGYIMIHSIISLRFLKSFNVGKEEKDVISAVKIHPNGLILIHSKNFIHLYKLFIFYLIFYLL